jgi:phage protein D
VSRNTQPRNAYRLTIDGKDITARVRPILSSLTISDRQRGEADELEVVLDDSDGAIELPSKGVVCRVAIGWDGEALVDKGAFVVDEVGHSGPPDIVTIRARSVDLTNKARNRANRSWHQTTLGAVIKDLAASQGLQARISPDLASIPVKHLDQVGESDVNLMTRLAKQHDATATVKGRALIFLRIGKGTTGSGAALPTFTLTRGESDTHNFSLPDRDRYTGVHAEWHDKATGTRKKVQAGTSQNSKGLRRVFHSQDEAQQYANAEYNRNLRGEARLSLTLARGNAHLSAEMTGNVRGWRAEIDGIRWLIASVQHTLTGGNGFQTSVELERLP